MKLKHENYDHVTVIAPQGEITADDVELITRLVDERLAARTRDFVLDLSQTDFIDSRGLETLLAIQDRAGANLGQVRLVRPTDQVRKILQVTRLDHYFDSHDDLEAAFKSLR